MMVNNNMTNDLKHQPSVEQDPAQTASRPNESGAIVVSAFVRITDPKDQTVILETRG